MPTLDGLLVRPFADTDQNAVVELWKKCGLVRPVNNPVLDIARKKQVNPELFLVGTLDGVIVASVMGGYEGHRGWANYLAVDPQYQKRGFGRKIMLILEEKLLSLGCPKINLQVRSDNRAALAFYSRIGFKTDDVISLGKRLIDDK